MRLFPRGYIKVFTSFFYLHHWISFYSHFQHLSTESTFFGNKIHTLFLTLVSCMSCVFLVDFALIIPLTIKMHQKLSWLNDWYDHSLSKCCSTHVLWRIGSRYSSTTLISHAHVCTLDNWKTFLNADKDSSKSATLILGGLLWKQKHSDAAIHRIMAALSEPYSRAVAGCNEQCENRWPHFSIHHKTLRTHVHLP